METIYWIITLFALGALFGMYLLALVLQKKETPKFVAFIHGAFVATALLLLIIYYTKQKADLLESIVLFVIAAVGGLVLIVRDLTKKPLPAWLALAHGAIAVTGFIYLLVYAFAK